MCTQCEFVSLKELILGVDAVVAADVDATALCTGMLGKRPCGASGGTQYAYASACPKPMAAKVMPHDVALALCPHSMCTVCRAYTSMLYIYNGVQQTLHVDVAAQLCCAWPLLPYQSQTYQITPHRLPFVSKMIGGLQ